MTRFILPTTVPKKLRHLLAADYKAALKEFGEANETEKKPELVLMSQKNFENLLRSLEREGNKVPAGNIFNDFVMLVGKVKVIGLQFFSDEFIEIY